ncbi:hypothetical protein AGMMS50218_00030 [Actinomycetota bacterium]|nr:hypothetical protein AGMMS50218_00030 [Actinomycetota bacterium]
MPELAPRTTTVAGLVRTAAVVLLAALGVTAGASGVAVAADSDVTWAVRTADNSLGADRTSFSYSLDPGAQAQDALVVVNHGADPLELAVYAADGYTTDSAQFDLLTPDQESAGVGAWLSTDASSVTVEPGGTAEVPFTVAIPDDATPGDYAGGIVTSLSEPDDTEGITVDRRLGIRVNLRVGGELAPSLAVEHVQVHYSGTLNPFAAGDATVTYTLHNTGNTLVSAQQAVSVAGPFGVLRTDGSTPADTPPQLLPGESWDVSVPVHDVAPTFRLSATATISPLVTDASGSTSSLAPVTVTAHGWAVPWTAVVLLVVLVVLVVLALRLRRRRGARRTAREEARVQEAVAQALRERGGPEGLGVGAGPERAGRTED